MSEQLKVSELIAHLESLKSQVGDVPVILWDADSDFLFCLKAEHVRPHFDRVVFRCDYDDETDEDAKEDSDFYGGWY